MNMALPLALLLLFALLSQGYAVAASEPFIWGPSVHVADAGWGRMIRLADGQWLGVSTLYPSRVTNTLQLKISADNARTWKTLGAVMEPGRKLDNGELIQLPNGDLLLTGRSVVSRLSYHLPIYRSKDDGLHWTYLSMIDANDKPVSPGEPSQGLWEPHFFLLPQGRLGVAYASEKHAVDTPAYSQVCVERVSDDGGATWGAETFLVAQPGGGGLRPGMPVVTQMKNGAFIEVSEIVGQGNADVYAKVSADGIHWPQGLGFPLPGQNAGPWVTSLSDGRVTVSSCSNQISVSSDYGQTWQTANPPAWDIGFHLCWPCLYQTGPQEIAAMMTHGGVNIRFGEIKPAPKP